MKILVKALSKVYTLLSYLIPVKKNYYAFFPLHDMSKLSGNIKAMLTYMQQHHKDAQLVIIAKTPEVKKEAVEMGIKHTTPIFGFSWALLRVKFLFIDSNWFPKLLSPKLNVIQLWHGAGFKNIALMDDNLTKEEREIYEYYYSRYALLISISENDLKKNKESFSSPNIVITGSPRNDLFFVSADYKRKIKQKYQLDSFDKIITYAPTFRDFQTIEPFSDIFWTGLQEFLERTNQIFVVKKHPVDQYLKVPTHLPNVKDLSHIVSDTQELLVITDLLISDYSSISTDFSLTGKPILTYVYDFEMYLKNCRSMYYNLEEILPKPFVHTEEELLDMICDQKWTETEDYKESYNKFKNLFHKYADGDSSRRVMDEVLKLK